MVSGRGEIGDVVDVIDDIGRLLSYYSKRGEINLAKRVLRDLMVLGVHIDEIRRLRRLIPTVEKTKTERHRRL